MRSRLLLKVLLIVAVSIPLFWGSIYASKDKTIATKISIAKGIKVSQGKDNVFGIRSEGGAITGNVTTDPEGSPLSGAWIVVSDDPGGEPIGWAVSGWDGTYFITGLPEGEYFLAALAEGHVPEYYDNVTEPDLATPVAVSDSGTTSDIHFQLTFQGPQHGEGSISGRIFDDSTGKPIEGAHVLAVTHTCIVPQNWVDTTCVDSLFWIGEAITEQGGTYTIKGLITGDYVVSVSAYDYFPEFYDNVLNPDEATLVYVEEPKNTPRIDFGLSKSIRGEGSITGVVLAVADSTPIQSAWVAAYSPTNPFSPGAVEVRSDGQYRIRGLLSGDYFVVARAPEFSAEWYDNVKTEEEATLVPVVSPDETSGIDFYLGYLGSISGRVTSEVDGASVEGAIVCAFPAEDSFFIDPTFVEPGPSSYHWPYCSLTDSNGAYLIRGLASGDYKVYVWALGFLDEWYDDTREWEEATIVTVVEPDETPDIDFVLNIGGSISGSVVREVDGEPIAHAWVCVDPVADSMFYLEDPSKPEDLPWDRWRCTWTDEDGYYAVTGLASGDYYVRVRAEGYLPEWYDGVRHREEATPVTVVEETETYDINFTLSRGGSISGTVVGEVAGAPLHAHVCAIPAADSLRFSPDGVWPTQQENVPSGWTRCAETDRSGQYTIDFLPSGEYFVFAYVDDGYLPEWYDDAPTWREATLVTVVDPENTGGIDFELSMGGRIEGHVVSRNEEIPVVGATVCAFQIDESDTPTGANRVDYVRCAETDDRGHYVVTGLKTGSYLVVAYAWGYREQWFEMAKISEDATPVEVVAPKETSGIDFVLTPWGGSGSISGRVIDEENGDPIPDAYVEARRGDGWWTGGALTRENGTYVIPDLPSGNYYVSVKAKRYHEEFYDDARNPKDATYVAVNDPFNTPDINFELTRKRPEQAEGGIAGRILTESTESDTAPLANAIVIALAEANEGIKDDVGGMAVTDEKGYYTIPDLPGGQFVVMCFAIGYIGELYDDVLDPREATLVRVVPPDVTEGIDFFLSPVQWGGVGRITGTIYENDRNTPAAEAWVYAFDDSNEPVAWDKTGPDGHYLLSGLAPGSYTVQASKVSYGTTYADNVGESAPISVGTEIPMDTTVDIVLTGSTETAVEDGDVSNLIPQDFVLEQNYPNPFNPTTDIRYQISDLGFSVHTTLKIYNLLGQEVRMLVDEPREAGSYTVTWDGRDNCGKQVASGFYFCQLQAGEYAATIRMVLMK